MKNKTMFKIIADKSLLLVFLIILGMLACGADDELSVDEDDDNHTIVGTWQIVSIDGMSMRELLYQQLGDLEGKNPIAEADDNLIFNADGSFFREISMTIKQDLEDDVIFNAPPDITLKIAVSITFGGTYEISDKTVEFIITERLDADVDISLEGEGAEFILKVEDVKRELIEMESAFEKEFKHSPHPLTSSSENTIYEFSFENNKLKLEHEIQTLVYRKK